MTMTPVPEYPAGAAIVDDWTLDDGTARRFFAGKLTVDTKAGAVAIVSEGVQHLDGRVDRHLVINDDIYLSASEARELMARLGRLVDDMQQYQ